MPAGLATRIDVDANGVAWIADVNTKVIEVVLDRLAYGWSPEEIHFQHSHLSLAQIYAALAYYYENQERLDAEMRESLDTVNRLADQHSSHLQSRLGVLKRET